MPTIPDITISAAIIANQAKPAAILKPVKRKGRAAAGRILKVFFTKVVKLWQRCYNLEISTAPPPC